MTEPSIDAGGQVGWPGPSPDHSRSGRRWPLVALCCSAVLLIALDVVLSRVPGYGPNLSHGRWRLLLGLELWWLLTIAGTWLVFRVGSRRVALLVVLVGLLGVQASALTRSVLISSDLYRYSWDGRVQSSGIDPYRYAPTDPALAGQRDGWLFPDVPTCRRIYQQPGCTRINYKDAHTIYPPVAEAEFALVHFLPLVQREHSQQLAGDFWVLIALGALAALLIRRGRDPRWVTLLAWSPLVGVDVGSDGHIDAMAMALVAVTLLVAARPPTGLRSLATGGLIGAAIAVKLYPVLVLPALLRWDRHVPWRAQWRRPAAVLSAAAGLVGLSYLPHVAVVGTHVIGFLPQYLSVEGYSEGTRFLLLTAVGLSAGAAKVAAVLILAAVGVAVLASDPARVSPARASLWLVGAAFLVATPVQPWYAVLLLGLAAAARRPEWLAVAAAGYPIYFAGAASVKVTVGTWTYGVAALVVAACALARLVSDRRGGGLASVSADQSAAGLSRSGELTVG